VARLAPWGLVLALLLACGTAHADTGKQFNAETFTLANGLQVVVVENHRAPIATQMIWYKVGSSRAARPALRIFSNT
jgi:zinc protease